MEIDGVSHVKQVMIGTAGLENAIPFSAFHAGWTVNRSAPSTPSQLLLQGVSNAVQASSKRSSSGVIVSIATTPSASLSSGYGPASGRERMRAATPIGRQAEFLAGQEEIPPTGETDDLLRDVAIDVDHRDVRISSISDASARTTRRGSGTSGTCSDINHLLCPEGCAYVFVVGTRTLAGSGVGLNARARKRATGA
jgi:hypothetical protein